MSAGVNRAQLIGVTPDGPGAAPVAVIALAPAASASYSVYVQRGDGLGMTIEVIVVSLPWNARPRPHNG
jgi:hypothetical protein